MTITIIIPKSKNTGHVKLYRKDDLPSVAVCTLGALKKKPLVILTILSAAITGIHNPRDLILSRLAYSRINTKKARGSKVRPSIDISYQNLTDGHSCILIQNDPAVHKINAPRINKNENTILFFLAAKKIINKNI
jgi:hypothetical protein